MENRYNGLLEEHNEEILKFYPPSRYFWDLTAVYVAKHAKKFNTDVRILEIGAGEGHSTRPVLNATSASIDVLDISEDMLRKCRANLGSLARRAHFICMDALEYLNTNVRYDIIYTSQTVHNFLQEDKVRLFRAVSKSLNPAGAFFMYDKVYPDDDVVETMLERQQRRYKRLANRAVCEAMQAHEREDASPEYRMTETSTLDQLCQGTFTSSSLEDRVERDVFIVAWK